MQDTNDDGSLAFLGIEKDPNNVQFHCEQTKQSKLVDTTFWVRDILDNVKTKHGDDRMLVLISKEKDNPESECQKFFIKQSFARKCAYLNRKNVSDKQYKQGIASWLGWAKYSNSHHLKSKMIKKKI